MDRVLRLRVQNRETNQSINIVYPCDKYEIFWAIGACHLSYGDEDYVHRARTDTVTDELEQFLTGVIENKERPPSMKELNYLATQLQKMSDEVLDDFKRKISQTPNADITETINIAHDLLLDNEIYDGVSMSERAVILGEKEPYIRLAFIASTDELYSGEHEKEVWINLPAQPEDFQTAARELGLDDAEKLIIGGIETYSYKVFDSLVEDSNPFIDFEEINNLAIAMKENLTPDQLYKYDAILEREGYFNDYDLAIELTQKIDCYEFFTEQELLDCLNGLDDNLEENLKEIASEFSLEETDFGYISDGTTPVFEQSGPNLTI